MLFNFLYMVHIYFYLNQQYKMRGSLVHISLFFLLVNLFYRPNILSCQIYYSLVRKPHRSKKHLKNYLLYFHLSLMFQSTLFKFVVYNQIKTIYLCQFPQDKHQHRINLKELQQYQEDTNVHILNLFRKDIYWNLNLSTRNILLG